MGKTRSLQSLMQAGRAFQESRVLLTALELDVFAALGKGASAAELSAQLGTDARATEMLLNALVAVGALLKRDGVFHCTDESKALAPARSGLLHMVHLWNTWSTLTECVKSGKATVTRGPESFPEARTRAFIAAMHARAQDNAEETARLSGIHDAIPSRSPKRARRCTRKFWTWARSCRLPRNTSATPDCKAALVSGQATGARRISAKGTTWCCSPPSATCGAKTTTAPSSSAAPGPWFREAISSSANSSSMKS